MRHLTDDEQGSSQWFEAGGLAFRASEMKTSLDNAIKEICRKEGVGEKELRMGVRTRKYSRVRAKISYFLSQELGVSRAEIARQLGVCTSAIAKAIQNMEAEGNKC